MVTRTARSLCLLAFAAALAAVAPARAGAQASVDVDSLEAMIRFLSVDNTAGLARCRFVLRESEMGVVADSLAARLERYLGASVDRIPFTITESYYSGDSTFAAENIVARLEGTGETEGAVLISAHYDAIALRTTGFRDNWETWPAPGADDNATGVAALVEVARAVAHRSLPFDVYFALFSGEELGKLGSADFAGRFESLYGDTILAVINLDMLGFRPAGGGEYADPAILSDYLSGWLADLVAGHAASAEPPLALRVVKPASSSYDHGPFWERHIPAITLTEPLTGEGFVAYPYYHMLGDTIGFIDFAEIEKLANTALGFLLDLAGAPADVAVLPSDILLTRRSFVTGVRLFETGDSIGVLVRVRNAGSFDPPAGAAFRLTVALENAAGTRVLYSGGSVAPPPALGSIDTVLPLVLGAGEIGENVIRASVRVTGMEDDGSNDAATERFGVEGGGSSILARSFQPNPVRGSFRSASFCVNLAREIDFSLEMYTLEGEQVAVGYAGSRWGSPLSPGMNCLSCGTLFPTVDRLAGGVYFYRMTIYDEGGSPSILTGRFAVEN